MDILFNKSNIYATLLTLILCVVCYLYIDRVQKESVLKEKFDLNWWTIGFSLLATDVSLSYVMWSAATGFEYGLAVGSYGWTSSLVMIVVAIYILPRYMRMEVKTIPEYIKLRFGRLIGITLAIMSVIFIVVITMPILYYSFSSFIVHYFHFPKSWQLPMMFSMGIVSILLLLLLGIKKAMQLDFYFSIIMMVAGCVVLYYTIVNIGGFDRMVEMSEGRFDVLLPRDNQFLPWTQVFLGGLWLMHFNYWAFFQPMVQKTLVASSLSNAQKGMLLAATLKLFIPFIFVLPGIAAFELFDDVKDLNNVFPLLLNEIIPDKIGSIILIMLSLTVISASHTFIHSAGIIWTQDIVNEINFFKNIKDDKIYLIGIFLFLLVSTLLALLFVEFKEVFELNNLLKSAFLPGIMVVSFASLYFKYTKSWVAALSLLLSVPFYFAIKYIFPTFLFIEILGVNTLIILFISYILTILFPLEKANLMIGKREIMFERNIIVVIWSVFIFTAVFAIYMIFL